MCRVHSLKKETDHFQTPSTVIDLNAFKPWLWSVSPEIKHIFPKLHWNTLFLNDWIQTLQDVFCNFPVIHIWAASD